MTDEPECPADPRPGDEPYYRESTCRSCGTELVLYDEYKDRSSEDVWHDEWWCPNCNDGIRLDMPDEVLEEMLSDPTGMVEFEE